MSEKLTLILNDKQCCDRCATKTANVCIRVQDIQRNLCDDCLVHFVEQGIEKKSQPVSVTLPPHRIVVANRHETSFLYSDGEFVPTGRTVHVDHFMQVFRVEVRSMNGVSAEQLKTAIQSRYEVTFADCIGEAAIVRK